MVELSPLMTVGQLLEAVNGQNLSDNSEISGFSSVATDSRNVLPGSLFVPLRGEFQDGHTYIPKALQAGASVVLVDEEYVSESENEIASLSALSSAVFIRVENTLRALQDAARVYVSFFPNLLKIGITGSSGKTTTKEITAAVFSQKYSVVMNIGNLNSETGLPLSVFNIRKEHDVGIFELGMNRRGEIAEITRVLSPSLALVTNVGTAHIGILGTQRAIAEEKKDIFSYFSHGCTGFVFEDDPWRDFLTDLPKGSIRFFGPKESEGYEGFENLGIDGSLIRYEGLEIHFPLPGSYNLRNALASITLARFAGIEPSLMQKGLESVKPLFGRTEIIRGDVTVLLDCYNANPDSMESAIDFCQNLEWDGKKIFVLASMLELGDESDSAHLRICAQAAASGADEIFLFGEDMVRAGRATGWGPVEARYFTDMDALSASLSSTVKKGDLVFLKGSRGMALERLCPVLNSAAKTGAVHG